MNLLIRKLSSLTKVFLDEEPYETYKKVSVFKNERLSLQLAYCINQDITLQDSFLQVRSNLQGAVSLYEVQYVPCEMPCYPAADGEYLRKGPGLFGDALIPLTDKIRLIGLQWHSLWVEINPEKLKPGEQSFTIALTLSDGTMRSAVFGFEVFAQRLPAQKLICTQWIHYDCIAQKHGKKMMSHAHMATVERYIKSAVEHGLNMLLVPLVTPPLDTAIGAERPTMQLVDIEVNNNAYSFDFTRLKAFIAKSLSFNIKYFEMTPLFTQWGAEFAPKVMAKVNGEYKRIFGWETKSDSLGYTCFLKQFLTKLAAELKALGLQDICYFHVSDEPQKPEHYVYYKKAYALMASCLDGFKIMDTLSSAAFYKEGYIKHPIAATDAFTGLVSAGAHDLWVYYCCAQYKKVSNHFIAMPSCRTRIFGTQLYRQKVWGFLHWGFNFWNSKYSKQPIDPFCNTDAYSVYPSGDPFIVYPGKNGPLCSIRQKVLREAFYDNRALQWLESLIGQNAVFKLLDAFATINFEEYPCSENAVLALRNQINKQILSEISLTNNSQ